MSLLASSVLEWVKSSVEEGATIQNVKPLPGATSSKMYSIELKTPRYITKNLVLRLFTLSEWVEEEPDLALHEAESLKKASSVDLATPELVAFDEDGSYCGVPAVLMTKVRGAVELKPVHLENWLDQLAEALRRIHLLDADSFSWHYFSYTDFSQVEVPEWSSRPDLWARALQMVKEPMPAAREGFIHRDFHPANVLWQNARISGVVDWVSACRGPAWVDIGHCRANLVMLYGIRAADRFLHTYQSLAGNAFHYHPFYDLHSLGDMILPEPGPPKVYAGWEAFGVDHLTDNMMQERVEQYLASIVERGDRHGHSSV